MDSTRIGSLWRGSYSHDKIKFISDVLIARVACVFRRDLSSFAWKSTHATINGLFSFPLCCKCVLIIKFWLVGFFTMHSTECAFKF